jgi:hypothetical protein
MGVRYEVYDGLEFDSESDSDLEPNSPDISPPMSPLRAEIAEMASASSDQATQRGDADGNVEWGVCEIWMKLAVVWGVWWDLKEIEMLTLSPLQAMTMAQEWSSTRGKRKRRRSVYDMCMHGMIWPWDILRHCFAIIIQGKYL